MKRRSPSMWLVAVCFALLMLMLSLYRPSVGFEETRQSGQPPFRNAVEQREEMIRELAEIKMLLKEQNKLLQQMVSKKN